VHVRRFPTPARAPRTLTAPTHMRNVVMRLAILGALAALCVLPAAQASPDSAQARAATSATQHRVQAQREHPRIARREPPRPATQMPSLGERVARIAHRYLGAPYAYGGATPSGFDCSGFVMFVYSKIGIDLPHHAASQYGYGRAVEYSALKAGDLVFFYGLGHVGLYVGRGLFIDAPQSGDVVRKRPLAERRHSFVGARRIVTD
jgi:peptidoglycan DL-endopeptidase CwlO